MSAPTPGVSAVTSVTVLAPAAPVNVSAGTPNVTTSDLTFYPTGLPPRLATGSVGRIENGSVGQIRHDDFGTNGRITVGSVGYIAIPERPEVEV